MLRIFIDNGNANVCIYVRLDLILKNTHSSRRDNGQAAAARTLASDF